MSYWTGLVSGYQGAREAEVANRALPDRVFAQLLASEDPQMKELALSGLMQPVGTRKKGLPGFFGEVESNPVISQIVAAMNEMIPDRSRAPPPPQPAQGAVPLPPPAPPPEVQRLQRRGTGLLTARQTAIMNAEVPLRTRIQVAQEGGAKLGLSPAG